MLKNTILIRTFFVFVLVFLTGMITVKAEEILFSDDFDGYSVGLAPSQLKNWSFSMIGSDAEGFNTTWEIVDSNGGKALYAKFYGKMQSAAIALISPAGSERWTDYSIEFDMTVLKNYDYMINKFSFSVPYRIQDISTGNSFIYCNFNERCAIAKQNSLGDYWSIGWDGVYCSLEPFNKIFKIMVKVQGNNAEFYKNGVLCFKTDISDVPTSGKTGIAMANEWSGGFEAIIDNVTVKSLVTQLSVVSLIKGQSVKLSYSLGDGVNGVLIISQYDAENKLISYDITPVNGSGIKTYSLKSTNAKALLWSVSENNALLQPLCPYLNL